MNIPNFKDSNFNLKGNTALITGGAGFLGQNFAEALLEHNCNVIISDVSEDALDKSCQYLQSMWPKDRVHSVVIDVTSEKSIVSASQSLESSGFNVDILINNAAINPKVNQDGGMTNSSRLENFNLESWNLEMSVGLTGAFLCTKVFGQKMANSRYGNIINIASDLGVIAPYQSLYEDSSLPENQQSKKPVTYSVIKHGIIGLTKYTATYWADKNVRCNALSPGGVFNNQDPNFLQKVSKLIPLQRMCNADELKGAMQYLCSDASSYLNGHNLIVDGGRSIW